MWSSSQPTTYSTTNNSIVCHRDDYRFGNVSYLSSSPSSSTLTSPSPPPSPSPFPFTINYKYSLAISSIATTATTATTAATPSSSTSSTSPLSITDHIDRIEKSLLGLLIVSFFPECIDGEGDGEGNSDGDSNSGDVYVHKNIDNNEHDHDDHDHTLKRVFNIFAPKDTTNIEAEDSAFTRSEATSTNLTVHESVIGMSSKPIDLANGGT